jgi:formate-dependent nitrite reductase membrane component NrfD
MEVLKPLLHDLAFPLCVTAMWGTIFLTVFRVLSQESLFKGSVARVLALLISILCVLGLFRPFLNYEDIIAISDKRGWIIIDIVLLVYGLFGLVVFISVVVRFIKRLFRGNESREFPREIERRMESLYPFRYVQRR